MRPGVVTALFFFFGHGIFGNASHDKPNQTQTRMKIDSIWAFFHRISGWEESSINGAKRVEIVCRYLFAYKAYEAC